MGNAESVWNIINTGIEGKETTNRAGFSSGAFLDQERPSRR